MHISQTLSPPMGGDAGCRASGWLRGRRSRLPFCLALALVASLGSARPDDGTAPDPPAGCRLVGFAGAEIEGLEQILGDASLFVGDAPTQGTPGEVIESLRLRERDTDLMAVAACDYYTGRNVWSPAASAEVKFGEKRRVVTADGQVYLTGDASGGLALQNLFFWDEQRDEARSTGQDLTYLRWNRPLGEDRTLMLRGALDLSWARGDTLAALFDYRRASVRIALGLGRTARTRWALEFGHKWVSAGNSGAYDTAVLEWSRGDFGPTGSFDLTARAERRVYAPTAVAADATANLATLGSYWDGEVYARLARDLGAVEIEPTLRLSGTRYDDSEGDESGGAYEDRLRAEFDLLVSRPLVGGTDLATLLEDASAARTLESAELGIGPVVDLLRVGGGGGDFLSAGGRIHLSGQGGAPLGRPWLDLSLEIGRRNYRGNGADLVFDYQGISFSLAQTDYTYYEVSVIGGGRLPLAFEWETYFSLDQEVHTEAADNGKLISLSFALKRRWCLAAAP